MENIDLEEIIQDTSCNGKYIEFYEALQDALEGYTEKRIKGMIDTLLFVYPEKTNEIKLFDKMKIIYEYSKLI